MERERREWRGREGSGEGGKEVEREGREWRGREGAGKMKEEKSEGEVCM